MNDNLSLDHVNYDPLAKAKICKLIIIKRQFKGESLLGGNIIFHNAIFSYK